MSAVKHLLRYIAGTIHHGCRYTSRGRCDLVGYSDADLAGDVDDRKSTTGLIFFLDSGPVSWQSQKQKVVALSSCEAEYIASTTAACTGVWLSQVLADLLGKPVAQFKIFVDNQSAIQLCKNPVFHGRSKHIETRFHYIRECVENGKIAVEYMNTDDQVADILTKSLGRVKFLAMRKKIGVVDTRNI